MSLLLAERLVHCSICLIIIFLTYFPFYLNNNCRLRPFCIVQDKRWVIYVWLSGIKNYSIVGKKKIDISSLLWPGGLGLSLASRQIVLYVRLIFRCEATWKITMLIRSHVLIKKTDTTSKIYVHIPMLSAFCRILFIIFDSRFGVFPSVDSFFGEFSAPCENMSSFFAHFL